MRLRRTYCSVDDLCICNHLNRITFTVYHLIVDVLLQDNMDLNRNFLTAEQWELALGRDPNFANYVDAMDYLSPSHNPFPRGMDLLNELHYVAIMSKVIFTNMMGKMKRALLSGNYHFPKGLGFGGREPS